MFYEKKKCMFCIIFTRACSLGHLINHVHSKTANKFIRLYKPLYEITFHHNRSCLYFFIRPLKPFFLAMQSCKFCKNGGNCIQPFICVPSSKKDDLIFESISQLDELPNDLLLTARRTSDVDCLEVRSNSSRALSTITDREEEAEEADAEDESDEDIELLLKKTRVLTHSQSAHADLAKNVSFWDKERIFRPLNERSIHVTPLKKLMRAKAGLSVHLSLL